METTVRTTVAFLCALLCVIPAPGQTLTVTSGFDGSSGPFIRTEMVVISLTGAEPFRPVTLLFGDAAPAAFPVPGVAGQLEILPGTLEGFGPVDGLGIFGPPSPFMVTDGNGALTLPVLLPATFPSDGLPYTKRLQAATLVNPATSPGGVLFALSSGATLNVDEPPGPPTITEVLPQIVAEGATPTVLIRGSGFLPQATVLPTVTFNSTCNPGASATSTSVQVVSDPLSPSGFSLNVEAPATLGGATVPPTTNSGPYTITVSFAGTGLFPNTPANAESTTSPSGENDPTFSVYQTAAMPVITGIDIHINPTTGGCPIVITGTGFLDCAHVIFDVGGSEVAVTNPTVVSDTQINVTPPPLPAGAYEIAVRNVDHVTASPRQSPVNPPVTSIAYVAFDPSQVVVTGITIMGGANATQVVEGTAGATMVIQGTCQQVGGFTILDPLAGPTGVIVGASILGMDAQLAANVTNVTTPAPGQFMITADVPPLPPGIAFVPPAPSAGGLTNTGIKHVQIVAPFCINPTAMPHKTFAQIPTAEPGNRFTYLAAAPPVITGYSTNNCGREDGNQTVTVNGTGFLTQNVALPSSNAAVDPQLLFTGTLSPATAPMTLTMINETTIEIVTPDVSALMLALPFTSDVEITNPDTQTNNIAGTADDFHFYPSLSGLVDNTFPLAGPTQLVQTTTGVAGSAIVYTFTAPVVTIPAGLLVNATGEHPLIIRARGDVIIDGDIDLSGASVTGAPFFVPAGAGRGAAAADLLALGVQDPFQGALGSAPINPLTGVSFPSFGSGGIHALLAGGAGGGGGVSTGTAGTTAGGPGGAGGLAYGFAVLPIPVLGAGNDTETRYPPGGAGGAAGGLGTPAPLNPALPATDVGQNGAGGNGGGGVIIAADGTITVNGTLIADGQGGSAGFAAALLPAQEGGGGGGGAGGGIVLQAIQGIFVNAGASLSTVGGGGGLTPGGAGPGGAGSDGAIRLAIPNLSANAAITLIVDGLATLTPAADTTAY